MTVASTAKRRRRQAANGYRHLAPLRRPKYSKIDAGKSRRRELQKIEKEKQMRMKKK